MAALDNLWSFASASEALTDERAEVIRLSSIFWSGCGVRKRTKPDISYVDIFVQPGYWGPWALVCSDNNCGGVVKCFGLELITRSVQVDFKEKLIIYNRKNSSRLVEKIEWKS
jgi:hypothetical protein